MPIKCTNEFINIAQIYAAKNSRQFHADRDWSLSVAYLVLAECLKRFDVERGESGFITYYLTTLKWEFLRHYRREFCIKDLDGKFKRLEFNEFNETHGIPHSPNLDKVIDMQDYIAKQLKSKNKRKVKIIKLMLQDLYDSEIAKKAKIHKMTVGRERRKFREGWFKKVGNY